LEAGEQAIGTAAELADISNSLAGRYVLTADIPLADVAWTPVGTQAAPFTGSLDGNCYKITNLTITSESGTSNGLFGFTDGATLTNLALEDVNLKGKVAAAIVGAVATNTEISNSYSTGVINPAISADTLAGGLVAMLYDGGTISNCYSSIDIMTMGGLVGGLVGQIAHYTGTEPLVEYSYSSGSIIDTGTPFATMSGGIAGDMPGFGAIKYSAAINSQIEGDDAGCILGEMTFSTLTANITLGVVSDKNNATVKTDAELKTQATYEALGWKFGNDAQNPWVMPADGGYPILYTQVH
jgi:hypothetical protein